MAAEYHVLCIQHYVYLLSQRQTRVMHNTLYKIQKTQIQKYIHD
jgi:hypothetical protein